MHNSVCHIEIFVSDMDRAQTFYQALFGWRFSAFTPDMVVFGNGDQHIGGLMRTDSVQPAARASVWFRVKELDSMIALGQELGGSVIEPKGEVPHVGWSAALADPDGNPFGMVMYTEDAV